MEYQEKKCNSCDVVLSRDNFKWYRAKNYIWKCNDCMREEKRLDARKARKENNQPHRERSLRYNAKLKNEDPVKYTCRQMLSSSKKRAFALNMDHNIDTDFLISIANEICPILGEKIKYGGGEKTKHSASLDRIDSSRGYTKDNVQIVSNLANMMKSQATEREMIKFAEWALNKFKGVAK